MPLDTQSLIWLFPIVFLCHDFEELILGEAWLKKNAPGFRAAIKKRLPARIAPLFLHILEKSTAELAVSISLIFGTTVIATVLAAVYHQYGFFIWASGLFFLHGFGHVIQTIMLRRYIPAVITSIVFVIPYGYFLFQRLFEVGVVDWSSVAIVFPLVVLLAVPFILGMHLLGERLYHLALRLVD